MDTQVRKHYEEMSIDISRVMLVDFNADGKTDIYYARGTGGDTNINPATGVQFGAVTDSVYLSKGDGTFSDSKNGLLTFIGKSIGGGNLDIARIKFGDFTGDGITDIYYMDGGWERSDTDEIYIGNGDGTFRASFDGLNTSVNDSSFGHASIDVSRVRIADINGDGISDMYHINGWLSEEADTVYISDTKRQQVTGFQDRNGLRTTVDYSFMTDNTIYTKSTTPAEGSTRNIQNAMVLVESVSVENGNGSLTSNYQYQGAKLDMSGRGYLGFEQVTQTQVEKDLTTITQYEQEFPYIGFPKLQETSLAGKILTKVETNWETVLSSSARDFPVAGTVVQTHYDPDTAANSVLTTKTTTNTINSYGNPTSIIVETKNKDEVSLHKVTTTHPLYGNERHGRVKSTTVETGINDNAPITRAVSYTYDTVGRIKTETQEPNSTVDQLKHTYGYDQYGNRTSIETSGSDILTRTTYTNYDGDGYFPTSVTNALGHSETRTYDPRFGKQVALTGPNGLTTNWQLDEFGRLLEETRADGTSSTVFLEYCDLTTGGRHADCETGEHSFKVSETTGTAPILSFYDKSDHEVRTRSTGFDPSGGTTNYIYSETEYDQFGRVIGKTTPYYYNGGQIFWNCTTYDELDRVNREYYPKTTTNCNDLTSAKEKRRIIYSGWVEGKGIKTIQVLTNIKSDQTREYQYQSEFQNLLGQKIRVEDAINGFITYEYDALGNMTDMRAGEMVGAADHIKATTTIGYTNRGYKDFMDDPDKGYWDYTYNVLGELTSQTDAMDYTTSNKYDLLGRLIERTEPGENTVDGINQITTWYYDTATNGVGKLDKVSVPVTDFERQYEYDSYGRPTKIHHTIDDNLFTESMTYASARKATHTYPVTGLTVRNHYDDSGYFYKTTNESTGDIYWQLNSMDALGQVVRQTLGENISLNDVHNPSTGRIASQTAGGVYSMRYTFDSVGNLEKRQDFRAQWKDDFLYDKLNRLDYSIRTDTSNSFSNSKNYNYDALGNITLKSDFGDDYQYNSSRPHAVTHVIKQNSLVAQYGYDNNGNMTSGDGRKFAYSSFGKVRSITKGANQSMFYYDADRMRTFQFVDNGNRITYYVNPRADVGLHFEKEIIQTQTGVDVEYKHFIYGSSGVIGVVKHIDNGATIEETDVNYLIKDHLGSTAMVVDSNGICLVRYIYYAFGEQGTLACNSGSPTDSLINIYHGYTGHEQLNDLGIIHMNGRLYDPKLGRMLQADIIVQAPGNTQSLNRYSYVVNNPLSLVDPSGYSWIDDLGEQLRKPEIIQAIGAVAIIAGVVVICMGTSGVGCSGAVSGGAELWGSILIASGAATIANNQYTLETGQVPTGGTGSGGNDNLLSSMPSEADRDAEFLGQYNTGGNSLSNVDYSIMSLEELTEFSSEEIGLMMDMSPQVAGLEEVYMCAAECAMDQFGFQTVIGGALTVAGSPILSKSFQTPGASNGTSLASSYLSKKFPRKLKGQIYTPRLGHLKARTNVLGRALGRFVPIIGQGILVYDGIRIGACTYSCASQ